MKNKKFDTSKITCTDFSVYIDGMRITSAMPQTVTASQGRYKKYVTITFATANFDDRRVAELEDQEAYTKKLKEVAKWERETFGEFHIK